MLARPPRLAWLVTLTLACVLAALLLPALPQAPAYHAFADARTFARVPNALNVLSNAGFLIAGLAGLLVTLTPLGCFERTIERLPYAVLFAGLCMTAAGSAWYHLAPDNERLYWDRLPMTIAFAGLLGGQLADRVDVKAGLWGLLAMLAAGVASVGYWRASERAGAGNVLPYAVLQGYAMVALLGLAMTQPSRYTRGGMVLWAFAWYAASKLLELMDEPVMALSGMVSGHTLKHVAASVSGLVVALMLVTRRPLSAGSERLA
jgi:hypothetical protein